MRQLTIIGFISLTLFSCQKDKHIYFDDRQLVFVNYSKGQSLKFIDTASTVQALEQSKYARDFTQTPGAFGAPPYGDYAERYAASYDSLNSIVEQLSIFQSASKAPGTLYLFFFSYATIDASADALPPPVPTLTVNGKTYTDVYPLKMVKYGNPLYSNTDTATLFHNKEYGVIEMLFPNGKKIVRTE